MNFKELAELGRITEASYNRTPCDSCEREIGSIGNGASYTFNGEGPLCVSCYYEAKDTAYFAKQIAAGANKDAKLREGTEPTRRAVGDKVKMTTASHQNIVNSAQSIKAYPTIGFVEMTRALIGQTGTVTHVFPPGYEATVQFGGKAFHMKDNWVESA